MFEGKRVVVTGAAGALGRAVVAHFADRGARVAVLDHTMALIDRAFPDKVDGNVYISCDLTERTSVGAAIESVLSAFDGIDVLCNVAGGFLMGDAVHQTSDDTWDFLFDLNARSIMNVSAAVVPVMLSAKSGKIVNIAARAALAGAASMGPYIASKAAVMRLTESMALELRESGINVNCIMPSMIDTPRNRADMPDADFSRWVPPEDLASVIGFLCSDAARSVHGAAIPVDGLS